MKYFRCGHVLTASSDILFEPTAKRSESKHICVFTRSTGHVRVRVSELLRIEQLEKWMMMMKNQWKQKKRKKIILRLTTHGNKLWIRWECNSLVSEVTIVFSPVSNQKHFHSVLVVNSTQLRLFMSKKISARTSYVIYFSLTFADFVFCPLFAGFSSGHARCEQMASLSLSSSPHLISYSARFLLHIFTETFSAGIFQFHIRTRRGNYNLSSSFRQKQSSSLLPHSEDKRKWAAAAARERMPLWVWCIRVSNVGFCDCDYGSLSGW